MGVDNQTGMEQFAVMAFEWDAAKELANVEKLGIEYKEEPRKKGWHFDPSVKPLTEEAQRLLAIPAPAAAGTLYERSEEHGKIVVKPMRGGKRRGAGRKPSGHVRLNLLIPVETREQLRKLATRDHVTLSEAFRRTIAGSNGSV